MSSTGYKRLQLKGTMKDGVLELTAPFVEEGEEVKNEVNPATGKECIHGEPCDIPGHQPDGHTTDPLFNMLVDEYGDIE